MTGPVALADDRAGARGAATCPAQSSIERRQRGLALIMAMLVAALAATVALSLAAAQAQWLAQVSHRRDRVQAQSVALAGVQWARQILDADDRTTAIDHLGEPWALPLPATPVENGSVEGRIVDAQSLLNANNLASGAHAMFERRRFERLFEALHLPAASLAAIVDWVDADNAPEPGGAEDAWYLRATEPTLAPNMPAVRVQELRRVRGMTGGILAGLVRYVTTLPVDTPLNVNTAPAEVLAASIANIEPGAHAALVASRRERPFSTLAEFRERLPTGASLGDEAMYTVKSRFFLVSVRARQGDTIAQARALIERGGNAWPRIVWQSVE
jgi:general secretion pathway protein K